MTVEATEWAWRQDGLKPADKLVLVAMSEGTHFDGWCSVSEQRLSDRCGMSRKAITASLDRLVEAGMVRREGHQVFMLVEEAVER